MHIEEVRRHEREARSYLRSCTDRQVQGVYDVEKQRLRNCSEGEVAEIALIMKQASIDEADLRGIELDR